MTTMTRNHHLASLALYIIVLPAPGSLSTSSLSSSSLASSNDFIFNIDGLDHTSYWVEGDINIGVLMSITDKNDTESCFKIIRPELWILKNMEAVAFAVNIINKNPKILPNATLGFVILDHCKSTNIALAQSLSFLPVTAGKNYTAEGETCSNSSAANSAAPAPDSPSPSSKLNHYDVIGILGPFGSGPTIPISNLYAIAKLPIISYMATGDELSNKALHPFFMRLIPPDKVQVYAMLRFIADKKWSYISVVYLEGSYGETAFRHIEQGVKEFDICIATAHRVSDRSNYHVIVQDLMNHSNARVVIIFAEVKIALGVMAASQSLGATGYFIWIGSDSLSDKILEQNLYWSELAGAFTFMYYYDEVQEFVNYFDNIKMNGSKNPWLKQYFEYYGNCSFAAGTCPQEAPLNSIIKINSPNSASLVIDSILTFAHAVDRLLKEKCPGSAHQDARRCIDGKSLLGYMFNSSFDGYTGRIEFDQEGNLIGRYEIRQMMWNKDNRTLAEKPIAIYNVSSKKISYNNDVSVSWSHLKKMNSPSNKANGFPESFCSKPCGAREYSILKEVPCCWECRACRNNEKLVARRTSCEACLKFTWPNPDTNYSTCVEIPVYFASVPETLSLIQVCLAVTAIIGQTFVVTFYIYFRKSRVIKAASRELSILQMVAIFVGYTTVILFQTRPTHALCGTLYFMFCLSFAWLYSPLIVKALRIYRIFTNSTKHNTRPRFVSPQSQLLLSAILIAIQVILCMATYFFFTPTAIKTQPVVVERYVELSCDLTLPGLASFLTYNLILISICSSVAFKTRKLPDNFNESWFMFMCVSTTLVIWSALIPTYFTSTRETNKTLLLSVALLLNHTVALVFLFIPKIYAAIYVMPENFVVTRFQTNAYDTQTINPPGPGQLNRVAPFPSANIPSESSLPEMRLDHSTVETSQSISFPPATTENNHHHSQVGLSNGFAA